MGEHFPKYPGPVIVTLLNGEMVFSDAEAWRHECEAKMLLTDYPLEARQEMLKAIEFRRGPEAADRLRATMKKLHEAAK